MGLVEVGLTAYAETYKGSTVLWYYRTGVATVSWKGKSFSVTLTADNSRDGKFYVDDSLFVKAFGVGDEKLVVYQDAVTKNVSIRANFCFSGDAANMVPKTKGLFYKTHFRQGVEEYWRGTFEGYSVSTYTGEHKNGIRVDIANAYGRSTLYPAVFRWSKDNVGSIKMTMGHSSINPYTVSWFRWAAAHEFGHVLGVDDAYNSKSSSGKGGIFDAIYNRVQQKDMDMVLRAWSTGRWQKWS